MSIYITFKVPASHASRCLVELIFFEFLTNLFFFLFFHTDIVLIGL